jgi:rubrerythrin
MSMLDNLGLIGKNGIRALLKSERERWTCPVCGGTINVHRGKCSLCGKERVT